MGRVAAEHSHELAIRVRAEDVRAELELAPESESNAVPLWRAGADANREKALRAAEKLRPFVEAARGKLGSGTEMTPARLANMLNAAAVPSAYGRFWSYNAAKNLLVRLGYQTGKHNVRG